MSLYSVIGLILTYGIAILIVGFIFISLIVLLIWYTNKVFFPKLVLVLMSMFEWPVKTLFWKMDVDKIMIDIANRMYKKEFKKIPYDKRIIFMPHCLRSTECPAILGYEGIECIKCKKCNMYKALDAAESVGTKMFILPGSSFIKRIIKKYKPYGILGVACFIDAQTEMKVASAKGLIPQCVILKKDGCINTDVEWDEVVKTIKENA